MKDLMTFIERNLLGKKVLFLFLITNVVYAFMLLVTIPNLMEFAGGLKTLDMLPMGYSQIYIENLFELLGDEGRSYYLWKQLPVDMIYPGLFAIGYMFVLAYFLEKLSKFKSPWYWLCGLPVLAGVFDYFENFSIAAMLFLFPEIPQEIAWLSSAFSITKAVSTTLFFVSLLLVLVLLLINKLRKTT